MAETRASGALDGVVYGVEDVGDGSLLGEAWDNHSDRMDEVSV